MIAGDALGFYALAVPVGLVALALVSALVELLVERLGILVDTDRRWHQ